MYKTILITREKESAISTASTLLSEGFAVKVVPLFYVKESESPDLSQLYDYENVLISSVHAAEYVIKHQLCKNKEMYVIGQKSAHLLAASGFNVKSVYKNSDALPKIRLLHLCGEDSSISYLPKVVLYSYQEVAQATSLDADIAFVYSKRSANALIKYVKNMEIVAISKQVAEVFLEAGYKKVHYASYPNEFNMIELLKTIS